MQKIGLTSLLCIVIGSQIGSGILLLPAQLAMLGNISLIGWIVAGVGAIMLGLMFARLSKLQPGSGGPYTYVSKAFGFHYGVVVAWGYWIISFFSTIALIISAVNYLCAPFFTLTPQIALLLQMTLITVFSYLNILGLRFASKVEVVFTLIKIVPLIILPLICIKNFNPEYLWPLTYSNSGYIYSINAATLAAVWGFVGVETATIPGNSVINPNKNIPLAILLGTGIVAVIYFFNNFMLFSTMPCAELAKTITPLTRVVSEVLGGGAATCMSIIAGLICLGTLNAWVLASSQVVLGSSKAAPYFPEFLTRLNAKQAPHIAIVAALAVTLPSLILTLSKSMENQLLYVIDISTTTFIIIYFLATLAYIKLIKLDVLAFINLSFTSYLLFNSGMITFTLALVPFLSSLPYCYYLRLQRRV